MTTGYRLTKCMCRMLHFHNIHFFRNMNVQRATIKGFHSTSVARFIVPKENIFFHELLEKRNGNGQPLFAHPSTIVLDESKRIKFMKEYIFFSDSISGNVCADFHKQALENSMQKTDRMDIVSALVKSIPQVLKKATDSEIEGVLFSLCLFSSQSTSLPDAFKNVYHSLDHECCSRIGSWTTDRQIRVADYFHHLYLSRLLAYNKKCIDQLYAKLVDLSTRELIHMLFFINLQREVSPSVMAAIEKQLFLFINVFTVEELSVACLAFFKTQNEMFFSTLIHKLYDIVLKNLSSITSSFVISSFLKQLAYSSRYEHSEKMEALLEACLPFISQWENPVLMRLCLMGSDLGVYNSEILNRAIDNIRANSKTIRLKEVTKIFFSSCHYGYRSPNMNLLVNTVLEVLRNRDREVNQHPQTLVSSLLALSYLNQYPHDILERFFLDVNKNYPNAKWERFKRDVAIIDCCIEIECPSYKGPRLNPTRRSTILKPTLGRIPSVNSKEPTFQERVQLEIVNAVKAELYPHECRLVHILPHYFRPDIVFCSEKDGRVTDFPKKWCLEKNDILYPENDHTYTVVVASGLKKFERSPTHLTGHLERKVRQLQTLGYRVITLPVSEFLTRSKPERVLLLKNKIRT